MGKKKRKKKAEAEAVDAVVQVLTELTNPDAEVPKDDQ